MSDHPTALVLDPCAADRALVAETLRQRLEFAGVHPVAGGGEAVALLGETPVDWLFVAWRIGETTAAELLTRLRRRPESAQVPCVLLFDRDEPQVRLHALVAGAADYLQKPLDEEALVRLCQRLCGLHRQSGPGCLVCELDLGFDGVDSCRAELVDLGEGGCVLQAPLFRHGRGKIGDIGTISIRCQGHPPLHLHGRVISVVRPLKGAPSSLPLQVEFRFAEPTEGEQMGLRRLVNHWRKPTAALL